MHSEEETRNRRRGKKVGLCRKGNELPYIGGCRREILEEPRSCRSGRIKEVGGWRQETDMQSRDGRVRDAG